MNRALLDALLAAGVRPPGGAVLILNRGPVPVPAESADWTHSDDGFCLLLLDDRGKISHFSKCRPADSPSLQGEARVTAVLRADEATAPLMPPVSTGASSTIRVLVTPYAAQGDWRNRIARLTTTQWAAVVRAVIRSSALLSAQAVKYLPEIAQVEQVSLGPAAAPFLEALAAEGEDGAALDAIHTYLNGSPAIPSQPQHGDLWPGNLLDTGDGRWLFVDFELFGVIGVPLYDACHFVRTCMDLRRKRTATGHTWLDAMRAGGPDARAARRILTEAYRSAGLTEDQAVSATVYYVADVAGRLLRRGARLEDQVPYRAEVVAFGRALDARAALASVLLEP